MLSYLSKVPDVEKVKGLKQLAFLHAEHIAARYQESPDILQAQELCWEDREGSSVSESQWDIHKWHDALLFPIFKELSVYFKCH